MNRQYEHNSLINHIAQGSGEGVLSTKNLYDHGQSESPTFLRFVILDVIPDPSVIDENKIAYWENEFGLMNPNYALVAPRNSIIAKRVLGNNVPLSERAFVLYPFFPPHIALPAKPGEHVWVMFENPNAKITDIGYWMCRIVGQTPVEDVNYTHADRQLDPAYYPSTKKTFNQDFTPQYDFPNGAVFENVDKDRLADPATRSVLGGDDEYEKILTNSDASKIIKYEPIPRYKKRPADVVIEGSNNSLIVLGTDRVGPVADYDESDLGLIPRQSTSDLSSQEGAGMIDLVVGRGQTSKTAGKKVKNKLSRGEIAKTQKDLVPQEGDPDFKTDRSRILVSQKTKADKNFGIDSVINSHANSIVPKPLTSPKENIKDDDGTGAIVIKSDKVRLIARQDVIILVTGAKNSDKDENGGVKDVDVDPTKCASIILRSNGDIVFTPSSDGLIKLGGDDADKAVLCTSAVISAVGGTVIGTPIVDTMGGVQGASDGTNGTFAKKILMK